MESQLRERIPINMRPTGQVADGLSPFSLASLWGGHLAEQYAQSLTLGLGSWNGADFCPMSLISNAVAFVAPQVSILMLLQILITTLHCRSY